MQPADERLSRLLDRHPELTVVGPQDGRQSVVVRDQLLVSSSAGGTAEESVRRWLDRREDLPDYDLIRLHLRTGADVDLVDLLANASRGQRPRTASLNHMMRGEPGYTGGPATLPAPASAPSAPGTGSDTPAVVAVLDTGITTTHPWFPADSWDPMSDAPVEEELDVDGIYGLDAQAGHGTFIAGIIRREAPGATLLVDRLLSSDGVCSELQLVRALDRVRQAALRQGLDHIDVLNLSLGTFTANDHPSHHVSAALRRLGNQTVVVAAAGNNQDDRPFYPAAGDNVVAVGALAADGSARAHFSNYGAWVDACAVGEDVTSSFVTWDGELPATNDIDPDCFHGFASWSGTSFATPAVAGRIAARASSAGVSAPEALDQLLADAPDVEGLGRHIAAQGVTTS